MVTKFSTLKTVVEVVQVIRSFPSVLLSLRKLLFSSGLCIIITVVVSLYSDFIYVSHQSKLVIDGVCICLHLDLFLGRVACILSIRSLVSVRRFYPSTAVVLINVVTLDFICVEWIFFS